MRIVMKVIFVFVGLRSFVSTFGIVSKVGSRRMLTLKSAIEGRTGGESVCPDGSSRRSVLSLLSLGAASLMGEPREVKAAVGSLPEFLDSNAILQGVTIKVADKSQQDAMISFLCDGLGFQTLRRRIKGSLQETWLGFGPEQLNIPPKFEIPVSSFAEYGGHASIHMVYDEKAPAPLYRIGDDAPGDNIAFLQVGLPVYRVSQMVKYGGNILDAYGLVNVVSPSGLPIRAIVGISPDPIMFVAVNCANVESSRAFYQQLGFVEQDYPYARPSNGKGQFEPPQPPKSVYLAPSKNCMGVLLLPSKRKKVSQNPVLDSLNIVYSPSQGAEDTEDLPNVFDPSGVPIKFQPVSKFEAEEKLTK
jgi:hypothetical protein